MTRQIEKGAKKVSINKTHSLFDFLAREIVTLLGLDVVNGKLFFQLLLTGHGAFRANDGHAGLGNVLKIFASLQNKRGAKNSRQISAPKQ